MNIPLIILIFTVVYLITGSFFKEKRIKVLKSNNDALKSDNKSLQDSLDKFVKINRITQENNTMLTDELDSANNLIKKYRYKTGQIDDESLDEYDVDEILNEINQNGIKSISKDKIKFLDGYSKKKQ